MDALTQVKADIDGRIAELRDEIERLEAASSALAGPRVAARRAAPAPSRARRARTRASSAAPAPVRHGRARGGTTRAAVLDALERAKTPLTAGEIAVEKGLGRASVSTTLSKLAHAGDVAKADRGYALLTTK